MCPTTLSNLAQVMDRLDQNVNQVQVLFVTLDPETDQPDKLSQYVSAFDARFLGLTGTEAAIQKTAQDFKIHVKTIENKKEVEHSTGTYILIRRETYVCMHAMVVAWMYLFMISICF